MHKLIHAGSSRERLRVQIPFVHAFHFFHFDRYQDLMDKGEERKRKLEDSIQRYSLLRDAHELESWINDKVCVCINKIVS